MGYSDGTGESGTLQGIEGMKDILVPVSPGELIDKITILQLKKNNITDGVKLANVSYEFSELMAHADRSIPQSAELSALWEKLLEINSQLWVIEDDIRACEQKQDFGPEFIRLARAVYKTNDRRAALKKEINLLLGSAIVEEKSYHGDEA